jgi:hypothetical protein
MHFAASALFDEQGGLIAFSEQIWIDIEQHTPPTERWRCALDVRPLLASE